MDPETHLALHRLRATELRDEADAYRLARAARRRSYGFRTRLGWTLVEVGLRLASAPRAVASAP
ncbi:hypothetical protein ACFS5L_36575 [Streptomyces phyllanthi]|uniref:hypothetical protein n=1 Tax=Streptomyces phyllanthi TaxID=1803180 RepID=UPI0031F025DD